MNDPEWSYRRDDLGIVYCLGRAVTSHEHDVVAAYYQTDLEHATKQTLGGDDYYRRFVYQGLPEERDRLKAIERPEVAARLAGLTPIIEQPGILLDPKCLKPSESHYRKVSSWLDAEQPRAQAFKSALQIACDQLLKAEVNIDDLSLYGAASFGLVGITDKTVEDIDIVFKASNITELRELVNRLRTSFKWSEIDPFGRLAESRQLLKAKRWSTSQIRLIEPYPLTIDLKVGRQPGSCSLWNELPKFGETRQYEGWLRVVEDTEAFCTSPALLCEDRNGNTQTLLLEGYQYIGTAVAGDVIEISGDTYAESSVILVSQAGHHGLKPDFRNVPVT